MDCIKTDPAKVHVMNNYALVEFIDDDLQKSKTIVVVKQNNSTKFRSIYVGKILDRPDFVYSDKTLKNKFPLDDLVKGETIIAYNPMSIQFKIEHEGKEYHVIRIEDVYGIVDDYHKTEVTS